MLSSTRSAAAFNTTLEDAAGGIRPEALAKAGRAGDSQRSPAARATADRGEAPPEAQAKPGKARPPGRRQQGAKPRKGGEDIAETNKAAVTRVTRKLLQRTEELLDAEVLSSADLDKLSNVIKDAAAVLGVKSALDAREQRGKIAVLLRRAEGEDRQHGPLVIAWEGDTEEAAQ